MNIVFQVKISFFFRENLSLFFFQKITLAKYVVKDRHIIKSTIIFKKMLVHLAFLFLAAIANLRMCLSNNNNMRVA